MQPEEADVLYLLERNEQLRRIHNVTTCQARPGWTRAQVYRAIHDANLGIVYKPVSGRKDSDG